MNPEYKKEIENLTKAFQILNLKDAPFTFYAVNLRNIGFSESEVIALLKGRTFGYKQYYYCNHCKHYKHRISFKKRGTCSACFKFRRNFTVNSKITIL